MVDINIEKFGNALKGQSRQNFQRLTHFEVTGCGLSSDDSILITAAQFPASNIGHIEVPFRGRKVKIPGDRTFADWTISIYKDSNNSLREKFVKWSNDFEQHEATGAKNLDNVCIWYVNAMDASHGTEKKRQIELINVFPLEVGPLEFSYDSVDSITKFDVTMAYDYWTSEKTGNRPSGG